MPSKRIFRFFPILLFTVCCQKTDDTISAKKANSPITIIDKHYNLSKDRSKDSIQRLNDITKSYYFANKLQNDTLILKILKDKTQLHNKNKQTDSAIHFSYEMLRLSEKLQDTPSIGRSYYKLGIYYYEKNEIDSSYQYYNWAQRIFLKLNDRIRAGKTFLNMAIIQSDIGDYFGSNKNAIETLKYLKSPEYSSLIASAYNCLAVSSRKQEDYEEALRWYDSAVNITNDEKNKIIYLNNIANVFTDQENYKKAISIYDSILDDPRIKSDLETKARILDNLTYSRWLMTGSNDLENKFMEALNIRLEENDLLGQIASNSHLSEYFKKSDIKKSIQYANAMYNIATQLNSIDDRLEALEKLINLDKNPEKIKKHSTLYVNLNDSITEIRVRNKNNVIEIMMENSDLETQKVQNQLKIERLSKQNAISFFIVLLFIMSSVFVYYQIKAKHKREKLQKVYETEVRLAKKLHDEVANDVYNIMSKLQKKSGTDEKVIDTLDVVYVKVRDISRANNDIDFDEGFELELKDLLVSYKDDQVNIMSQGISKIRWNKLPVSKRIAIYRVLQELLVNMKKHSKATNILMSFKSTKNKLIITYSDNGIGCDLKKKNGLQNAENRIETINGTVIFESEKNKGFKVKITV